VHFLNGWNPDFFEIFSGSGISVEIFFILKIFVKFFFHKNALKIFFPTGS